VDAIDEEATETRGVTRGAQFPGRRMTAGAPKNTNNVTSTIIFNTVHLLPKNLRFKHWGVKLAVCPRALSNLVTPLTETDTS